MSLNFITLSGVLPQDSEIRYTMSGKPVLEFDLVVQNKAHAEESPVSNLRIIGRKDNVTEWHQNLKKGVNVIVEGQLFTRFSDQKTGFKKKQAEINLDNLYILDSVTERI